MRSFVRRPSPAAVLVVSTLLATACGPGPASTTAHDDVADVEPGPPAENAVLEFLNDRATDAALLDVEVALDRRAADGLIAHRDGGDGLAGTADDDPFDTLGEVDSVPYVGPSGMEKIVDYVERQGWLAYQGGTFEGVAFTAGQVALALDLANAASEALLDDDVGLDQRAAQNVVSARPIGSMNALAGVAYVGPSALRKIRSFLPTWQENGTPLEVYDGVGFTHLEAARALAAANDANLDALSSVGIFSPQSTLLIDGRVWPSLAQVAAAGGIGPLTMSRLKTLGEAYADAVVYVVTAPAAQSFATHAKGIVSDDLAWRLSMIHLLTDVTGDLSYAGSTATAIVHGIRQRIDAYAPSEVGRAYSSSFAARDAFVSYARGLQLAAKTDYPAGALSFVPSKTVAQKLARAKLGILAYWQDELVKSAAWQETFGKTWNQVKTAVEADVANFQNTGGYGAHPIAHGTVFTGRVYGLYTEATVDDLGKVTQVFVEID